MSSKYVRDQMDAYLAANWSATVIVDAENEFSDPPANLDPWLTVMYLGGSEQQPCLGPLATVRKREVGSINLIVFVASGTGTDVALDYAEQVRVLVRGVDINGVRMLTVDPPDTAIPSQAQSSQGNFFGYAVSAQYEYDYT